MTFAQKNWGDCSKAVAYELNFVQQCDGYENETYYDYFAEDCDCGLKTHQIKNLQSPKDGFSKKDYFELAIGGFGVSEKLKNNLVSYGIDESFFSPVTTKVNTLLGYQLVPKTYLPHIYGLNDTRVIYTCPKCGEQKFEVMYYGGDYDIDSEFDNRAYNGMGYPTYICEDSLKIINEEKIVKTREFIGAYRLMSLVWKI